MTEDEKEELLKRKKMLFRYLDYQVQEKEYLWDNEFDFQNQIDSILGQIISINLILRTFSK